MGGRAGQGPPARGLSDLAAADEAPGPAGEAPRPGLPTGFPSIKPPSAGQLSERAGGAEAGPRGSPWTGSTSAGRSDTSSLRSPAAAIFEAFSSHPPRCCCCRGCRSGQRTGGRPRTAASAAAAPYPCPNTTQARALRRLSVAAWPPSSPSEGTCHAPASCPPPPGHPPVGGRVSCTCAPSPGPQLGTRVL